MAAQPSPDAAVASLASQLEEEQAEAAENKAKEEKAKVKEKKVVEAEEKKAANEKAEEKKVVEKEKEKAKEEKAEEKEAVEKEKEKVKKKVKKKKKKKKKTKWEKKEEEKKKKKKKMQMETEDEEEEDIEIEEDEEEKKPPWYRLPEIVWEKVGDFLSYRPLDMYNLMWTCRRFRSMYSRPNYWRKALVFLGNSGHRLHLRRINGASRRFCTPAMLRCFAWDGLQEVYIESESCQQCLHPRTALALKDLVLLCGNLKKLTAKIQGVMYHNEQTIQIVVSMMRSAGEGLKTVQMFAWPITFRGMRLIDGQLWEETLCPGLKTLNLLLTKGAKGAPPNEAPMRWCPVQFVEMIWNFTTYEVLYLRSHMFNMLLVYHLIENPPANLRCIIIFFKSKDVNDMTSHPIREETGEAFNAAFPQVRIKLVLVVDKGWANSNDQRLHAKFKLEWLLVDTVWIFDTVMHEEVGGDPCASRHVYRILELMPAFGGTLEAVNVVHPRSLSSDEECRLVEHLTGDWADWPSLCRDVKLHFFVDTRVLDKDDKKRYMRVLNDLWEL